MKYYFIPLMLIVMSCNKPIKDKFRATLIGYQKEFPIPEGAKESGSGRMYIYQVHFSKHNEDTVFAVNRTYSKIENGLYKGQKIHRDRELKSLVITDIFNVSGDLTDAEVKSQHASFWDTGSGEDEQHTPIYWYKVKDNNIYFLEKDTTYTEKMFRFKEQ